MSDGCRRAERKNAQRILELERERSLRELELRREILELERKRTYRVDREELELLKAISRKRADLVKLLRR